MAQRTHTGALLLVALMMFSTVVVHFAQPFDESATRQLGEEVPAMNSGQQGFEVLYLGNSYVQSNNLEGLTEDALQQEDAIANVASLTAGGLRLDEHANRVQTSGHQWNTTLNNGNWDWVILQDQSQVPSFPISGTYWQESKNGSIILDDIIDAGGAETVFMMTWGRRDGDSQNTWRNPDYLTMQAHLESGYRLYAENVSTVDRPAWVAPAGLAYKHIYDDIVAQGGTPEDSGTLFHDLYSSDGSHPSLSGSYLATCVVFSTLTGDTSVGLIGPSGLSQTRILELQEAAAATVFNETPNIYYPWMRSATQTFSNGNASIFLHPALNESTAITHRPGQRATHATFDLTASAYREWDEDAVPMLALAPNSTYNNTAVDANGNLRLNRSGAGTVPNSGTNNTVISSTVTMSGNHSYDTLHLLCGIVSCGEIIASGGPLRIYANVIKIELGASIVADEMVWGNSGAGTSTSRAANGKSPGAGGGGHGAVGGSGGGTNGGAGGTNYGNGSEPGSSGGNVTHTSSSGQISNDASGGRGGGVVELVANTIYVNGTISADGGRADDGAPPARGSGPGGSGAGGGSGGSISLLANTIYIGGNAVLRADGGDGGDGENGACAPTTPCLFMYDGGHGGGGGAGGVVLVATMVGQLTNNGVMQALAGSGGARGAPYGTGAYGTAGSNGNNGYAFTGTFAGWSGSTNYVYAGSYVSPTFGTRGVLHIDARVNMSYSQPVNTSIEGTVRYTVDGSTWSSWRPVNLSGDLLPPFALVQFQLNLSTTDNNTTPTIQSIGYNLSTWQSLEDVTLDVGITHGSNEVWSYDQPLGIIRNSSILAPRMGGVDYNLHLPVKATPLSTGWIHVMPPNLFVTHSNVTFALSGTPFLTIHSSDFPEVGVTIPIPVSVLQSNWPNNGRVHNGSGGIEWADLDLNINCNAGYFGGFTPELIVLPYELNVSVGANGSLLNGINHYVNITSNRWAEADFSEFPILSGGDGLDDHEITLNNLNVTFIDDILPEVSGITFLVDGQPITTARVGDLIEIRVRVLGNESDLVVDWHLEGLGVINSWPPVTLQNMTWDSLNNVYIGVYDTSQHSSEFGDRMALWLWMTDSAGNDRFPIGVSGWSTSVFLRPVYPELAAVTISGCDQLVITVCEVEPGASIHFEATAVESRTDLDVFVHLVRGAIEEAVVPLQWDEANKLYRGDHIVYDSDFGWWSVTWRVMDINRNEDNYSVEAVSQVNVLDRTAPTETNLSVAPLTPGSSAWEIWAQWNQSEFDDSEAWVEISGPDGHIDNMNLVLGGVADSLHFDSYIALGSRGVNGAGSSDANNSTTGLIHQALQETWPQIQLTNMSKSWATVQNYKLDMDDIRIANPDIVTILPLDDYDFSSTSVWSANYPWVLDQLGGMGAQVYIASVRVDPDYICHIGEGPGGCYTFGKYEMIREKNEYLNDLASTRPWVTIVPLSDDEPLHVDWFDSNGDYTDAGHAMLADAFIRAIEGRLSLRTVTQGASVVLDASGWTPGQYDFEFHVRDGVGTMGNDLQSGTDATYRLMPDNEILSLSILTTSPAVLYPGDFEITYDAYCSLDCGLVLEVELDGEPLTVLYPVGGEGTFTLSNLSVGSHQLLLHLSTPDWEVGEPSATLEFEITPVPAPVWSMQCSTAEVESLQIGVSRDNRLGNLTVSTHSIDCAVENSGDANGTVRLSNTSTVGPFSCSDGQQLVVPEAHAEFSCTVEESDDNAGIYPLSLIFEQVDADGGEVGTWESTIVLATPRFQADVLTGDPIEEEDDNTPAEVAGQTPLSWMVYAVIGLLIGIAAITALFALRDRKDPYEQVSHRDSLFDDTKEVDEESDSGLLHPSLEPIIEPPQSPPVEIVVEIPIAPSRVDSHTDLPGGGDYVQADGVTWYVEKSGIRWKMDSVGGFERLD